MNVLLRLLFLVGVLFPVAVQAQSTADTGSITGVVRDGRTGEPLGEVDVTYVPETDAGMVPMEQLQTVQTLPNGRFEIDELPPGRYLLRSSPPGFPAGMTQAVVRAGETTRVQIRLDERREAFVDTLAGGLPAAPARRPGRSEYFDILGINYFLASPSFGAGTNNRPPTEYSDQVKFRVAFNYEAVDLQYTRPNNETGIYLSYEQNSFWHLYDESAPFFDNNYKPGAYAHFAFNDYPGLRRALGLPTDASLAIRGSLIHESNGRDGPANRSWNRWVASVHAGRPTVSLLAGSFSTWHAFGIAEENADLLDFAGRAGAELFLTPFHATTGNNRTLVLHVRSRFFGKDLITNVETNLYYGLPGIAGDVVTPSFVLQFFSGYAENLLTYDERREITFRFGIAVVR